MTCTLLVTAHGVGWWAAVEDGALMRRLLSGAASRVTERPLAFAIARSGFTLIPWTLMPLLPLAAISLRGSLPSQTSRCWTFALCAAGTLVVAPHMSQAAIAPAPASWPTWPYLGNSLGLVLGIALALGVIARAWHRSILDEERCEMPPSGP